MHLRRGTVVVFTIGAVTAVAVAGRNSRAGRSLRRGVALAEHRMRYLEGRLEGVRYRLAGRSPSVHVPDDVLADRIRAELGPLEKRLDVPHIHVMVEDRVALLHGDVPSATDLDEIERAVKRVAGVMGVESHLHVGLLAGDTRPSAGRAAAAHQPSTALRELLDAAEAAGVPDARARQAVRAVLGTFTDRIPAGERDQVLAHVPADVRALAAAPRRSGERAATWKSLDELVARVRAATPADADVASTLTHNVVQTLRRLVPDEARDVAAVLPVELRELWSTPVAS